jgi:hypothetical protein
MFFTNVSFSTILSHKLQEIMKSIHPS